MPDDIRGLAPPGPRDDLAGRRRTARGVDGTTVRRVTLDDLPDWARRLLDEVPVARLGLLDERDHPRVLPVTFAVFEGAVWSAIDHKPKRAGEPARVRRLRRRPEAALLVDRYDDDWSRLAWLELRGPVTIEPLGPALEALAERYPQYRDEPPQGPLLRLEPRDAAWWRP